LTPVTEMEFLGRGIEVMEVKRLLAAVVAAKRCRIGLPKN